VKDYLLKAAVDWIRKGSNGWRLDVPNEIEHWFWKEFRKLVKAADPEAFIVGEIWQDGKPWLGGDEFDSVMNYRFKDSCVEFFALRKCDAKYFVKEIGRQVFDYSMKANYAMFNLLSSHDTARFFTVSGNSVERVKLAVASSSHTWAVPSIYYGEEIGMEGGKDPDNRRFMVWDKGRWNMEIYEHYRNLIRIRKETRCSGTAISASFTRAGWFSDSSDSARTGACWCSSTTQRKTSPWT